MDAFEVCIIPHSGRLRYCNFYASDNIARLPTTDEFDKMENNETLLTLVTDIVSAHVANNTVSVADLPSLITSVHSAMSGLGQAPVVEEIKQEPAVSIRSSIKPDHIVCLEDGKKLKMLKRHLMTHFQMTPTEYRAKWKLPSDYPMVAPNYAEQRRTLAKAIGLGRKPKAAATPAPVAEEPKAKAPRKAATAKAAPATTTRKPRAKKTAEAA